MGSILRWLLPLLITLWTGCSMNSPMSGSGTSIEKPPFPKTKSILPLALGNCWVFTYTEYDSVGNAIVAEGTDLHLSITGGYGLKNDSVLVPTSSITL